MVNAKRVEARGLARLHAEELFELLSWPDGYGADYADALCKALRDKLPKRREAEPEKPEPYERLAATVMSFGQYGGQTFADVPSSYLDWLCGEEEEFLRKLQAYLKHPEHRSEANSDV